jgi:ribosomal protein L7/L12
MKLVINRNDIIDVFAAKTGLEHHQIHDVEVRNAIASIYDEAMNIQEEYRAGKGICPNKISLIKAVRTLVPNTSLKDAKEYVENNLLARRSF